MARKKKKVFVAMSGGVDSSVAAALLKEQGFDVVGVFMKNWSEPAAGQIGCSWAEDQKDMRRVCQKLDICYYTFDFEKEYKQTVVENFFNEYQVGRTPNPDVLCNKEIKFKLFLAKAKKLGADYIATGHYARIASELTTDNSQPTTDNRQLTTRRTYHLLKGADKNKDQSYFLWTLGQNELQSILFPIGEMTKPEVRKLARKWGLATAKKKDSQGICFIGPIKVRDFLKTRLPVKKGMVLDAKGNNIGEHEGAWFYTIGQRVGMDKIKWSDGDVPILYVVGKDIKKNIIIAGPKQELYVRGLICDNVNWVNKQVMRPAKMQVMVRYRQMPVQAKIKQLEGDQLKIIFRTPQRAIAPGQSVVIYKQDELLGGGIIQEAR